MKKIILSLLLLTTCIVAEAKVIKITLTDGSLKVFTSSQLSSIDFNDDGTLTICTYDGEQLPALNAEFNELTIGDEAVVYEVITDTLKFSINADGTPVNIPADRPITKLNYVYPSTDPDGEPVTLSGTILVPDEIWNGQTRCEGILMVNHYTKFSSSEAPTLNNGELENMLLANPLRPNYIIVESDFYGFGVTERFPQAFLQGLVNARSSLDGLLAARQLLEAYGFDYGPLCFNVGYSSGGFDALASQKLRDMEYADRISFDKTFSGGGPSDVCEAFRQYVLIDRTAYNAVPLLMMVSTNETQHLDIPYTDVFQPYISNRIDELILSKAYSSWPVCDSIGREKLVHEILSPTYCNLESPECMAIQDILRKFNLTNDDWTPDLSQRIYLFHSRGDDYVPIQSARPMIPFLKSKGFEPSIIPGKTNFQTNFVVREMGHLKATLVYYIQTLAAIKAWPLMYTEGQLNPEYQPLVGNEANVVSIMRQLDAMGFDCKRLLRAAQTLLATLSDDDETATMDLTSFAIDILGKLGYTEEEIKEMSEDSGLDIQAFVADLLAYLSEDANPDDDNTLNVDDDYSTGSTSISSRRLANSLDATATPVDVYSQQLKEWIEEAMPNTADSND